MKKSIETQIYKHKQKIRKKYSHISYSLFFTTSWIYQLSIPQNNTIILLISFMNLPNSLFEASSILNYILSSTFQQIRKKQLQNIVLPIALTSELMIKFKNSYNPMVLESPQQKLNQLHEQTLNNVPYHGKDSLMPKGVERQSEIDSYNIQNESFILPKNRKYNQTRQSRNSALNRTNRTSNFSVATTSKKKKKQQTEDLYISLAFQKAEQQDPEIIPMRWKKQLQIRERNKTKIHYQERKKLFEQNQENFVNEFTNKEYTYDFEGSIFGSEIQADQKIKYHGMKIRLAGIDRKNRSNIKFLDSQKEPSKIIPTKSNTLKKENQMGFQGIEMSQNIPVFQNQAALQMFGLPADKASCRLKEYKKYYGGRFTRLDRESKTIDMGKSANEEHDQLFKSRRYLKDQDESLNQSFAGSRSIDKPMRRLALPKIKGKYSTLDRYSYHED